MPQPVIIEAAINGATTKQQNPNVPVSPEEIAADTLACIAAGAAIIHNHIDRAGLSGPDAAERYLEAWRVVLAARPDALIYPTVNFGPGRHDYDHIAPLAESGLMRMGLCDPGSTNLGRMADGIPTGSYLYSNTYDDIAYQLGLSDTYGLGPSLAIYEPGFLRTALAYHDAGRLPRGSMLKFYLSADAPGRAAFGLPPTPASLDAYLDMLGDRALPWAVSVPWGDVVGSGMAKLAIERGGHIHLGLEFYGGPRQPTNVELINEAVTLVRAMGREPATPDETAALLDLAPRPVKA